MGTLGLGLRKSLFDKFFKTILWLFSTISRKFPCAHQVQNIPPPLYLYVVPSTSIQMDGALPPDFSKSETDSDIITKLFSVIYVQKL